MSIKYNGKTIAGGYIPKVSSDLEHGIIRIATNEEVRQGRSNDVAITPKQLNDFGGRANLFDTKVLDYVLSYEKSEGWALQGTYVYKTAILSERYGYPSFVDECIKQKNQGIPTEFELGSYTITMYCHSNGHVFYNISDKEIVDSWFEKSGIANFYGIDVENECVFLPRNNYFMQSTTNASKADYGNKLLYYCVGNTISDTSWIDTVTQTANGVQEIEDKRALSLEDIETARLNAVTNIEVDRANAITNIETDRLNAVNEIEVDRSSAVLEINTDRANAVDEIEQHRKQALTDLINTENEGISALANASNALRTTQVTNCLTEMPQRIKYDLTDGTLTIKAGSVVIVPYGTEDLTSQYPVGATFINDNFKVYDTQFADGKFFVWAELVNDVVSSGTSATNLTRFACVNLTTSIISTTIQTESGTSDTTQSYTYNYTNYYNTSTNLVGYTPNSTTVDYGHVRCFPFMIVVADGTNMFGTINQIFNGMGYIGSTIWVDKGVKGLIPNGRNEDGTLRNVDITTNKLATNNVPNDAAKYCGVNCLGVPYFADQTYYYNKIENRNVQNNLNWDTFVIAELSVTNGQITSFNPKQPFRAVDQNSIWYDSSTSTLYIGV